MRTHLAALAVALLTSIAPAAHAAWFSFGDTKNDLGAYNFNYSVRGAKDISPLQVFDDGKRTYLQFNLVKGVDIPAIFMPNGSAMVPARYAIEGPYVVVDHVATRLELVGSGNRRVSVVAEGKPRAAPAVAPKIAEALKSAPEPAPKVAEAGKPRPSPAKPGITASQGGSEYVPVRSGDITRARRAHVAEVPAVTTGIQIRREPPQPAAPTEEEETLAQLQALQAQMNALMQRMQGGRPARAGPQSATARTQSLPRAEPETAVQEPQRMIRAQASPGTKPGYLYAVYDAQGGFKGLADRNPQGQPAFESATTAVPVPVRPLPAAVLPAKEMELRIENEQRLSEALRTFLSEQGWDLEWTHTSDFVVRRGYVIRGAVIEDMMQTVLKDYRLSATFYNANRVVAVGANP